MCYTTGCRHFVRLRGRRHRLCKTKTRRHRSGTCSNSNGSCSWNKNREKSPGMNRMTA